MRKYVKRSSALSAILADTNYGRGMSGGSVRPNLMRNEGALRIISPGTTSGHHFARGQSSPARSFVRSLARVCMEFFNGHGRLGAAPRANVRVRPPVSTARPFRAPAYPGLSHSLVGARYIPAPFVNRNSRRGSQLRIHRENFALRASLLRRFDGRDNVLRGTTHLGSKK